MTFSAVQAANGGRPAAQDEGASDGSCTTATLGKNAYGLFADDNLGSVTVRTSRYRTRTGVHVGQSSATVYAKYRRVARSRHTYIRGGAYLEVTTGRRRLVFEVDAVEGCA